MWKVPPNAAAGSMTRIAQAGQALEEQVDLDLSALGGGSVTDALNSSPAVARGEQPGQFARGGVDEHVLRPQPGRSASPPRDVA